MKVVSDTSPVMNLHRIGYLHLLGSLCGMISIPEAVHQEWLASGELEGISLPVWITIEAVEDRSMVTSIMADLHPGEAEAIALAVASEADLLLIDERRARRMAHHLGLRVVGLLGILLMAKQSGKLPAVKPLLDALLSQAGFWVSQPLYDRVLQEAGEGGD